MLRPRIGESRIVILCTSLTTKVVSRLFKGSTISRKLDAALSLIADVPVKASSPTSVLDDSYR